MAARPRMTGTTGPQPQPQPQPAARARALVKNPEEWIGRAVENAWHKHTIGTLTYLHTESDGTHVYCAQSRSHPEMPHLVLMNITRQRFSCDCPAASYGLPCSHVGAAWHALQQMLAASVARNMLGQQQYEWWSYYSDAS